MKKGFRSLRLHIGIFGRTNVGKSSVLNTILRQDYAIVSDIKGTTTDPVEKAFELQPIGPVQFIDTAGIDDIGALGEKRVKKTESVIRRTDLALIIIDKDEFSTFEKELISKFKEFKTSYIIVRNKIDLIPSETEKIENEEIVKISCVGDKPGFDSLLKRIIDKTPADYIRNPHIAADLVKPSDFVVLVIPIDKEAPKGRLIAPQVQTIRELLDNESIVVAVKERELAYSLSELKNPPAIVITDSQSFLKAAADVPEDVPMTSFSILFARVKGDLEEFVKGTAAIDNLKQGDKVMICESCSHHPITDDIGTVKIPRWLNNYVGGKLEYVHYHGHDFPDDIDGYKLIIHCGGCVINRKEMLSKQMIASRHNVPMSNYGMAISFTLGIFERALKPFPDVYHIVEEWSKNG